VDLKRLIDNAPQMIESRGRLEREFAPRDTTLKADEKRLADSKQRYDRDNAIMAKADAEALSARSTHLIVRSSARVKTCATNSTRAPPPNAIVSGRTSTTP